MRAYLQTLEADVWEIIESGYQNLACIPSDTKGNKQYETNVKVVNSILESLDETEFVKVIQLNTTTGMWDNIIQIYEGYTKVKGVKLQTFVI